LGSNVVAAAPVPSLLLAKLSLGAAAACGGAWWVVCLFA